MNVIDSKIIEILGEPDFKYGKWFVPVRVTSYGHESKTEVMTDSQSEASNIRVGDIIQC